MSNIILIGFRGVGKSTIAEKLALRLGKRAVSLDEVMKDELGNLQDFIKANGWEAFRDAESRLVAGLDSADSVVDSGGGVIEREENIRFLREKGTVVWLKVSKDVVYERLKGSNTRLSLKSKTGTTGSYLDEIEEVMSRRNPLYKRAAHITVDTDSLTIDQIVEEIAARIDSVKH